MSGAFAARRLASDLHKARKLVQELDERSGDDALTRTPLWLPDPAAAAAAAHADEDERASSKAELQQSSEEQELQHDWDAMSAAEQLACCLQYLRQTHTYCMYCGQGYDGAADLAGHCPGATAEEHDQYTEEL